MSALTSAKHSLVRTRRISGGTLQAVAANYTTHTTFGLEGAYTWVRFLFENDTATAYTVDKVFAAPSAWDNGTNQPVDENGTAVAWTQVTFGNLGADKQPWEQVANTTYAVTVPAQPVAGQKGYAWSDWMLVPSLNVKDNGWVSHIMVRCFSATAGRGMNAGGGNIEDYNAIASGRTMRGFYRSGDQTAVSTGWNYGAAGVGRGIGGPAAVQYIAQAPGVSVLSIGDSITQGVGSPGSLSSWAFMACTALSHPGRQVSLINSGWSGQASAQFYARGRQEIDLFNPEIVTIAAWTPNDTVSQASADLSFGRAMDLGRYAVSKGIVPIFLTPIPYVNLSNVGDRYRRSVASRVRALGDAGFLVFDADAALRDGSDPGRIIAEYHADGTHPNLAGHSRLAEVFKPVLQHALGEAAAFDGKVTNRAVIAATPTAVPPTPASGVSGLARPSASRFGSLPTDAL